MTSKRQDFLDDINGGELVRDVTALFPPQLNGRVARISLRAQGEVVREKAPSSFFARKVSKSGQMRAHFCGRQARDADYLRAVKQLAGFGRNA